MFPPGLVKILKKHDKRTGAVLRLPFIRRVLLQPFFATELLSKLVQDCENLLSMFPPPPLVESIDVQPVEGEEDASREAQGLLYPTGYHRTCQLVFSFLLIFKFSHFYPSWGLVVVLLDAHSFICSRQLLFLLLEGPFLMLNFCFDQVKLREVYSRAQ